MRADVHEIVAKRFEAEAQLYTAGRRRLVDILSGAGRPLSILDVLAAAPGLPQSSAYRNLAVLEQADVIARFLAADGTARYELAEGLLDHHPISSPRPAARWPISRWRRSRSGASIGRSPSWPAPPASGRRHTASTSSASAPRAPRSDTDALAVASDAVPSAVDC